MPSSNKVSALITTEGSSLPLFIVPHHLYNKPFAEYVFGGYSAQHPYENKGHKTEKEFKKYIKTTEHQTALELTILPYSSKKRII